MNTNHDSTTSYKHIRLGQMGPVEPWTHSTERISQEEEFIARAKERANMREENRQKSEFWSLANLTIVMLVATAIYLAILIFAAIAADRSRPSDQPSEQPRAMRRVQQEDGTWVREVLSS